MADGRYYIPRRRCRRSLTVALALSTLSLSGFLALVSLARCLVLARAFGAPTGGWGCGTDGIGHSYSQALDVGRVMYAGYVAAYACAAIVVSIGDCNRGVTVSVTHQAECVGGE
jgi:hypothetical protein